MAETKPAILRGLIIENAFTSIADMVDHQFNVIKHIKGLLVRNYWDNTAIVGNIHMPVLFIAGSGDQLVPEDHTRKLHALTKKAAFADLYIVKDANHSNCWEVGGKQYTARLKQFIDKSVKNYELEIFDEWAAGDQFDKHSELLQ